jgi:dihydropteroate synthase
MGVSRVGRRGCRIRGRGRELVVAGRPVVMGILNVTPDSFSDGGVYVDPGRAIERGIEMMEEGADIIDVGGESTRPGAVPVSMEEEARRVLPIVERLAGRGLLVSVDTMKSEVARLAMEAGAWMINDVSAMTADPLMASAVREHGAAVVLMHMRGEPATMQRDVEYKDLVAEVYDHLASRIKFAEAEGIAPESVVIDPGIGFGKSALGNLELLSRLREFSPLKRPVLVGASRKSFIGSVLGGRASSGRLFGSLSAAAIAVFNGADIIRAHDVKETLDAAKVAMAVRDKELGGDNGDI